MTQRLCACGKVMYESREEARRSLAHLKGIRRASGLPLEDDRGTKRDIYQCPITLAFHLGTKPRRRNLRHK